MTQIVTALESFGYGKIAILLLLASIFIDISPKVKFNPWKAIFNRIGKYINNSIKDEISGFKVDVYEKIDQLGKDQDRQFKEIRKEQNIQKETLNNLIHDQNYNEMSRLRWEVINFESNMFRGNKYPREQYRHIIDEAEKYLRMANTYLENKEIIIDAEDVIKMKESLKKIQRHYDEAKEDIPSSYMI